VVIVVLGDGRRQWATVNAAFTFGRHASHFTDGLANTCTHMQLAIASLGLGSHWGTVHVQEPLKRVLGVPDLIDVYLIISVGFADIERQARRATRAEGIRPQRGYDMSKFMSNEDIIGLPLQAARQNDVPLSPERQSVAGFRRQEKLMRVCHLALLRDRSARRRAPSGRRPTPPSRYS